VGDGFLGRWSRRKDAVRKGEEVAAEAELTVRCRNLHPNPPPQAGAGK
jgi:hypothetical protein